MAYDFKDKLTLEEIADLRKSAAAAEPYPDGVPVFPTLDEQPTSEEMARKSATMALRLLQHYGIPLEPEE